MMYWLSSYPRSGNTAIRLFLERYTRRPTRGVANRSQAGPFSEVFLPVTITDAIDYDYLDINKNRPYIKKNFAYADQSLLYPGYRQDFLIQKLHGFLPLTQPKDRAVFLLRDYKDVLFSAMKYNKNTNRLIKPLNEILDVAYAALEKHMLKELNLYIEILKGYHQCKSYKMLIRYEDLIRGSYSQLEKILLFLNIGVYPDRLRACDPVNDEGKREIDAWFTLSHKGGPYLSPGSEYIGRHKNYIKYSTIKRMGDKVASEMGDLHELYTKVYDVE